jgi:hypothetical protein
MNAISTMLAWKNPVVKMRKNDGADGAVGGVALQQVLMEAAAHLDESR